MRGQGRVSVIIPTYFRNERLSRAIESVQAQTYEPIQTVVVDDSGEEHARPVVADFDDITYVPHTENQGAHAARETGLKHAEGEFVQLLDDDDVLHPTKVRNQVDRLQASGEIGVVYCGMKHENGRETAPDPAVSGNILSDALRFFDHPLTTATMLIRADVLNEVRPLYRDSKGADDIRMMIELARRTEFGYVDEVLVTSGRPSDSRGMSWGGVEGRWEILADYEELYASFDRSVRNEALSETYQMEGRRRLEDRWWSLRAIYCFGQALRYAPDVKPVHIGEFISAFGGRLGRKTASKIADAFTLTSA